MMDFMLSPTVIGNAELSEKPPTGSGKKLFRKQILPIGEFNYRGQKLDLSKERLEDMRQAWHEQAYDQIPFQLADEGNSHTHTKDPRYTEGEMVDVEVDDQDGLVGTLALSDEGAKIVEKNPKLGVSAKINFNHVRDSDQAYFPAAIEHVLGTINPHLKGMSPWKQVVTLSENGDGSDYADYSDAYYRTPVTLTEYDDKGADMGDTRTQQTDTHDQNPDQNSAPDQNQNSAPSAEGVQNESDDEEEFHALMQELVGEGSTTSGGENGGQSVADEDYQKMALSVQEQGKQVAELTAKLNEERWRREAQSYVQAGVPPSMVELAAPIMTAPESTTVELSDGKKSDPASVIRQILHEAQGTVDLSEESGHQDSGAPTDEDEAFHKAAMASLDL